MKIVTGSLTAVYLEATPVPGLLLQVGGSSIVVILAALAGAVAILLRAASTHFDPSQDDDEDSDVEVATAEGGGGGGHHHSLEETVTAEITADPGAGEFKVSRGPIEESHGPANKVKSVSSRSAAQCSHCGAVNKEGVSLCWNCGSNPDTALQSDDLSTVNERLREVSTDNSYVVEKGEEPRDHPVNTAANPQEQDEFEESDGTTEDDIRKEERPPIWRVWIGAFLGWLRKWQMLINVHARSMVLVALVAAVFWGISLIYGASQFGTSGFIALLGASTIAILSASIAVLFFLAPGKWKTIGLAYPFTLNVVLLPPLIIAYYEPVFTSVWSYSTAFAVWILDTLLNYNGINTYLRQNYTMTNGLYILMWFAMSYPAGWVLGSGIHVSKKFGAKLRTGLKSSLSQTSTNATNTPPDHPNAEGPNVDSGTDSD